MGNAEGKGNPSPISGEQEQRRCFASLWAALPRASSGPIPQHPLKGKSSSDPDSPNQRGGNEVADALPETQRG